MTTEKRCRSAIRFGVILHTRCHRDAIPTHVFHEGRGLAEFPDQRIEWNEGHRNSYQSDRDDDHAWEQPAL